MRTITVIIIFIYFSHYSFSQIIFTGNIHNVTDSLPMPNAAVVNITLKKVTYTGNNGKFSIEANWNDTIEISHLGYITRMTVVTPKNDFIRIFLAPFTYEIAEIGIIGRTHKKDSIENRMEFRKAFEWHPVTVNDALVINPMGGVGISIDAIYEAMRFRHNQLMKNFQATIIRDEQERYIDYKFTTDLVTNLTGLHDEPLELFMKKYRPPYYFLIQSNEYAFYSYIKSAYNEFRKEK